MDYLRNFCLFPCLRVSICYSIVVNDDRGLVHAPLILLPRVPPYPDNVIHVSLIVSICAGVFATSFMREFLLRESVEGNHLFPYMEKYVLARGFHLIKHGKISLVDQQLFTCTVHYIRISLLLQHMLQLCRV